MGMSMLRSFLGYSSSANHMLAVRMMRQLMMLGEELDPAWTVMDMDMASMLLLLDHSLTVTFKAVPQFSAAIEFGTSVDSFDIYFAGDFMSRFADNVADSGIPRLLRLLMMIGTVSSTLRMASDILHPEPCRVQLVGNHYPPHPPDHRYGHPADLAPSEPEGALLASSCPPHTLRPPEMLHWSRSLHDLPLSHRGRNPGQHVPDAVKQALQSVTSFAALYQDPSARHHVRPPDQPPHLNRQVGLLEQLMEDDPSTHGAEGWVCHRTVSPGAAGPGL